MKIDQTKIKLILLALVLVISFKVKAQRDQVPFSLYVNGNYALTMFDINTPTAFFFEGGLRFNIIGGLHVGLQGTYHSFVKSASPSPDPIKGYETTLTGGEVNLIYEFPVGSKLFIGPGVGLNVSTYTNSYTTSDATFKVALTKPIYVYRYFVNGRVPMGNLIDFQFGVSFNDAQSKYMDGFPAQKNFGTDVFIGTHVGLLYHVGAKANKRRFSKSRKLRCPRFF